MQSQQPLFTLSHLTKLTTLRLPQSTSIVKPESLDSSADWPPLLERLQLGGRFSPTVISYFRPPPRLTSLTLKTCADLSLENLGGLLGNPWIGQNLKRLTISGSNRGLQPECICAIPSYLPELVFLHVPGDLVENTFFDILHLAGPPALEVLEFGYPYADNTLKFDTADLVHALEKDLTNVCSVGFSEIFCTELRILEDEMIDDVLLNRSRKQPIPRGVEEDHENDELDDTEVGVYYM
ncbi:hypothetical protein MW887_001678 [Aspergillus wentii]|nr:hypothetical protein MW887_001678 [Aspergillus wentii]